MIPNGIQRLLMERMMSNNVGQRIGQVLEDILDSAYNASFSIAAEATNEIVVSIQLKNENGDDLDTVQVVDVFLFANAAGTAFNANNYTIAAGTDGAVAEVVADKVLTCTCEADGDLDISLTIAGAATCYLGVRLPTGKLVISSAITHAA